MPSPQPSGLPYAFRIFVGCVTVWFVLDRLRHHNPAWAMISVITVTEPEFSAALQAFYSRVLNTVTSYGVGLLFLDLLGSGPIRVLVGITASVFVCTLLIWVPESWRAWPDNRRNVITPSALGGGKFAISSTAIERAIEVLPGCVIALPIAPAAFQMQKMRHCRAHEDRISTLISPLSQY